MNTYIYSMGNGISYVPVHLNSLLNEKDYDFGIDYVEPSVVKGIIAAIKLSSDTSFLIDLKNIRQVYSRVYAEFSEVIKTDKKLIFCNANEKIFQGIKDVDLSGLVRADENKTLLFNEGGLDLIREEYAEFDDINNLIKDTTRKFIADYLKENSVEDVFYLDSSNVYSNKYVDIKSIFNDHKVFSLTIYELCLLIKSIPDLSGFNRILSSSHNGSAISNIVGDLLGIDVVYVQSIGPHLAIHDTSSIDKISPSDRFLFLYDFICLGTELKIATTLAGLYGAKIVASVGVAHHFAPGRENGSVKSIFKVNDDYDFGYKLFFNEGDVANV